MPDIECPVCSLQASYVQGIDVKTIDCPHCGKYKLSGTAEKLFETRSPEVREAALHRAQRAAQIGELPVISSREIENR